MDFEDTLMVKTVKLDEICRQQQVHDGCFAALTDVRHRFCAGIQERFFIWTVTAPHIYKKQQLSLFPDIPF